MAEASWPRRNQPVDDFACRRDKDKAHKKRIALDLEFRDLAVFGRANVSNIQETVFSVLEIPFRRLFGITRKKPETQIIHSMDGLIKSGELVAIIGKPASGCSTLLKALAGQLHGLRLGGKTKIEFGGISQVRMMHHFGGEINYLPEIDMHFPYLSVNQTLHFAAALRAPYDQLQGRSRNEYANQAVEKALETYNLKQTISTRVGNEFIRGVSGGERRRVSIAEMALSNCVVSCWDQSTKGLDSSSALAFIKSLRELALNGSIHIVTIYQASDQVLRQFDKVIVLYEGRQVYFGSAMEATVYFEEMGWQKPRNQPIGDFLAAVTNPEERKCREGYEHRIPSTAEEFEQTWKSSPLYLQLLKSLDEYESKASEKIGLSSELEQVLSPKLSPTALGTVRKWSTCVANVHEQVRYCSLRMIQRLWNEKMTTIATNTALLVMALILGTLFFQTKDTTDGLYSKAAVLFSALLLNAMVTVTEIFQTQGNKPIIEKQVSYRFYRPAVEAWSSILLSIPLKFITATVFNIVLYFLSGLRKTPGAFFTLFLFVYVAIFVMSAVFKTIAAGADSTAQAFVFVGVILPLFIVYTGFVVPEPYMKPWFKWLIYINPVKFAFESLMSNELHGRTFNCTTSRLVPPYAGLLNGSFVCAVRGSIQNQPFVSGDAYMRTSYNYYYSHLWRNLGILFAFTVGFIGMYLIFFSYNIHTPVATASLSFRRGHAPKGDVTQINHAGEKLKELNLIHTKMLSWRSVCYDVPVGDHHTKRLLQDVSGWVKPGELTALMGVSGAGKTTLLDALARRLSQGVVSGEFLLDGKPLPNSFERSIGYVQQLNVELETATVREALRFSALMRQPRSVRKEEKFEFVERVIAALGMEDFAEAVVGVPGHGLAVNQRKLLSIGIELAARPSVLLFLDEPTTGLDAQSAFSVVRFLRYLTKHGVCVLCTIHQPSSVIFEHFDRLLLLVEGGKTAYFGEIGQDAQTVTQYFEGNGARIYDPTENPAEFLIDVASGSEDWNQIWKSSKEFVSVEAELGKIKSRTPSHGSHFEASHPPEDGDHEEDSRQYALPLLEQCYHVTFRVFQQYWRTPTYVWAKIVLAVASSAFIGFTFYQVDSSIQGMQNSLFAIFLQSAVVPPIINQIIPKFVSNQELYQVQERPSKTYAWPAFLIAQILAEIPYQIFLGILIFAIWHYTVLGVQTAEQEGLILLFFVALLLWAGTLAQLVISAVPNSEAAAMLATVMFSLSLLFSGVLQPPSGMPQFWKFLWRVSPLTYWIGGIASTGLHGRTVKCAVEELSTFNPPRGLTCDAYMQSYLQLAPGHLINPNATADCQYCSLSQVDQYLAQMDIYWSERWRNFGIFTVYICFNVVMTIVLYYFFASGKFRGSLRRVRRVLTPFRTK